jgi:alkyl sulfatase BDS1-like metallo-beta-lactamase superfamily hydrolase
VAFFTDGDQFYACTKALFKHIEEEDPGAADDILASRLVIRIHCTEPDVEFMINGRQRPVKTTFGPSPQRPTMDIKLPADTLHHIMLGELSLKKALANGKLQVRGPVLKVTALADLFYHLQAQYPQVLREQGLLSD